MKIYWLRTRRPLRQGSNMPRGFSIASSILFLMLLAGAGGLSAKKPPRYDEALKLYARGKYNESLEVIRKVITVQYRPYAMRMLAAANYSKLNKHQNAIEHMLWCIKENPGRAEPRIFLVGLLRKTGHHRRALSYAAGSMARHGENVHLRLEMARANYLLGRHREARRHLDILMRKDRKNSDAVFLDGLIFLRQGNFDIAEFRFRHALSLKPKNRIVLADLYNNLGFALEKKGDASSDAKRAGSYRVEAEKMYRYSILVRPNHPLARQNLARLMQKRK